MTAVRGLAAWLPEPEMSSYIARAKESAVAEGLALTDEDPIRRDYPSAGALGMADRPKLSEVRRERQRAACRELGIGEEHAAAIGWDAYGRITVDAVALVHLVPMSVSAQRDQAVRGLTLTHAQRAAVSAHWSAQLRAKVAASREAERNRVVVDLDDDL